MLIGLIKDESAQYDGYNWHDEYAKCFKELGDVVEFFDFRKSDWQTQVHNSHVDCFLWRAWHRPDDKDDAKNKIQYIDQELGRLIFPNWRMYWPYDNKLAQLFIMRKFNLPHPFTFFSRDSEEITHFMNTTSYPLISKSSDGACGDNVRLIKNKEDLKRHIDAIFDDQGLKTYFPWVRQKGYVYLQEYLPLERDLRIITLGDEVVYACWFESEDWKKFGGNVKINFEGIPSEAKELCINTSKKINFDWAAYDVAFFKGEYYIFEFSAIFGFSFPEPLVKQFGSPNAHVLQKQVIYTKPYVVFGTF